MENSIRFQPTGGETQILKIENVILFEVYNINNLNEKGDYFEVGNKLIFTNKFLDSKLKRETNYKDNFETFKQKLKHNEMKIENEQLTPKESITGDTKIEDNLNEDWDQFEQNKNKFNVESTYQEEKYTTKLNLEEIPEELKREAEKIEKVNKLLFLHFHSLY